MNEETQIFVLDTLQDDANKPGMNGLKQLYLIEECDLMIQKYLH